MKRIQQMLSILLVAGMLLTNLSPAAMAEDWEEDVPAAVEEFVPEEPAEAEPEDVTAPVEETAPAAEETEPAVEETEPAEEPEAPAEADPTEKTEPQETEAAPEEGEAWDTMTDDEFAAWVLDEANADTIRAIISAEDDRCASFLARVEAIADEDLRRQVADYAEGLMVPPVADDAEPTEAATDAAEDAAVSDDPELQAAKDAGDIAEGTCGSNAKWWITSGGYLYIDGSGTMSDYDASTAPWYKYRSSIEKIAVQGSVTSIGTYAFYGLTNVTNAAVSNSVLLIGGHAFAGCTNLKEVVGCVSVNKIDAYAFSECSSLSYLGYFTESTSAVSKSPLSYIGESAFYNCTALSCFYLPDGVKTIKDNTFNGCTSLKMFGNGDVESIGYRAFYNCTSLKAFGTSGVNSVKFVGKQCFMNCTSLEFSHCLCATTTYSEESFRNCSAIEAIHLAPVHGFDARQIDNNAFAGCSSLKYIVFDEADCSISSSAFSGVTAKVIYLKSNSSYDSFIGKNYGGTLTWIPSAGYGMANHELSYLDNAGTLTLAKTRDSYAITRRGDDYIDTPVSVIIMPGVTDVTWINGMPNLTSVSLSDTVQTLGSGAFSDCPKLTSITIPASVNRMDYNLFKNDTGLKTIIFLGDAPAPGFLTSYTSDYFVGVTAKVYYNSSKSGWSTVAGKNYGGNLTWVAYTPVSISKQPASVTAPDGKDITFSVTAKGQGLTYQWQQLKPNGSWANCSATGSKTATLKVSVTSSLNGYKYRCIIKDIAGNSVTSSAATLTLFSITTQPKSANLDAGQTASLKVVATGSGLTYQWQELAPGGSWVNSTRTGNATATLSVKVSDSVDGYKFRCVITSGAGDKLTSSAATVTVYRFEITTQPEPTVSVKPGDTVTLTVAAMGSGLTYQWQYCRPGGTWAKTSLTGNTTASLTVPVLDDYDGMQYRCVITDSKSTKLTSDAATLVFKQIEITRQPYRYATVILDQTATISVEADGSGLTYQWQECPKGGEWVDSTRTGCQTAELIVTGSAETDRMQFRCIITDTKGEAVTTSETRLEVYIAYSHGNMYWDITLDGTLSVSHDALNSRLQMKNYTPENAPWYKYHSDIKRVFLAEVNNVGDYAFYGCENLAEVISYRDMGYKLGVGSFMGCSSLESVSLVGVNELPAYCFAYCTSLKSLTIPASVTTIGTQCFAGCGVLESITIPEGVTSLGGRCFAESGLKSISLPSTLTDIEEACFSACTALESIVIPEGVTSLGFGVFEGSGLKSISLPSTLTSIGMECFAGCTGLEAIEIPESVTTLGVYCFGSTGLKSIALPAGITSIPGGALSYCDALETVTFLGDAPEFDELAFVDTTTTIIYDPTASGWDAVVGQNFGGNLTWRALGTLEITQQPADQDCKVGQTAYFTVEATGNGLSYQWQFKSPTGSWAKTTAAGYDTDTLEIPATAARDGYQYRCVITDANGNKVISEPATLTVEQFIITSHPQDLSADVNTTAVFTVAASGSGLTYQWQFKAPGSTSWAKTTATGYNTDTLKIPATMGRNNYQYRCVITNANGNKLNSNAATLTVTGIVIKTQPKDASTLVNSTAKFTVVATGNELTYQWQFKSTTATSWAKTQATGYDTATLEIPATMVRSGYQYRCVITDANGNKAYSEAAALKVVNFYIKAQPKNVSAAAGSTASFSVTAVGDGLTYQWQFKSATATSWAKTQAAGYDTATLQVPVTSGKDGYQYRCVITDADGNKLFSEAAVLTVNILTISKQPTSVEAAANTTATFTVAANGTGLTYQWYFKTPAGTSWNKSPATGSDTATLQIPATTGRNGYQYRCVITDANGAKVTSEAATLIVMQ